jgi:hypothetical protein
VKVKVSISDHAVGTKVSCRLCGRCRNSFAVGPTCNNADVAPRDGKSVLICKKELVGKPEGFLQMAYGFPADVCHEMVRGARHFEEIEVWGKHEIRKDPIAVGLTGNERYLICRWGIDKLIPFAKIKSRSWLYHIQNFGVTLLTSATFWLSTAAATIIHHAGDSAAAEKCRCEVV